MLELLTNNLIDDYIFIFLSLSSIITSFLAVKSENTRNSIIYFLTASFCISGIVCIVSESILAIVLLGIYISVSSLFMILSECKKSKPLLKSEYFIVSFVIFLLLLIIYIKSSRIVDQNSMIDTGHYSGISGITLFMSIIFIYVIFGVISVIKRK